MSKPILKIISGPSPTKTAAGEATLAGTASVVSALSKAAELLPHDEEGLLQFLRFRIAVSRQAEKRSCWIGGRIYNRIAGEEPEYVPLSGAHLRQTLSVCGIDAPNFVINGGQYMLLTDYAQQAVNVLSSNLSKRKSDR